MVVRRLSPVVICAHATNGRTNWVSRLFSMILLMNRVWSAISFRGGHNQAKHCNGVIGSSSGRYGSPVYFRRVHRRPKPHHLGPLGVSAEDLKDLETEGFGKNDEEDEDEDGARHSESRLSVDAEAGRERRRSSSPRVSPKSGRRRSPSPKSTKSQGGWGSLLMDRVDGKCTEHINEVFQEHLGPDYVLTAKIRKMQMRLRVYTHKSVEVLKDSVQTSFCNTGLNMGVVRVANKGGQIVKLTACKGKTATTLCFVNSHLAAHEGHAAERDASIHKIMDGVEVGRRQIDFSHQCDYSFWMGDMNYRTDFLPVEPGLAKGEDKKADRAAVWARVHSLTEDIAGADVGKATAARKLLWQADELMRGSVGLENPELDAPITLTRDALNGWQTLRPMFRPTFKVIRDTPHDYVEKRIPSYTDKVLWTHQPGFHDRIRSHVYDSFPDFLTSDHKPVHCGFTIVPTLAPRGQAAPLFEVVSPPDDVAIKIAAFDLSCKNIVRSVESRDVPDPYLKFYCSTAGLIDKFKPKGKEKKGLLGALHKGAKQVVKNITGSSSTPQTTWKKNDVNPDWGGEIKFMKLQIPPDVGMKAFCELHLLIACLDHDDGAADDRLGVVSVCLADLFAHPGGVFELKDAPLRNNGKLCGMLSAKFVTFHSNGPDEQNKPFMDKVAAAKVMTD